MYNKVKWQLQNLYLQSIANINLQTNKYNSDNFIWINGSGRSGTTWLGEMLTTIPNSKLIDEPLRRSDSKKLQKIDFRGIQHIPQDSSDWDVMINFFDKFFKGAEFNPNHFHLNIKNISDIKYWIVKEIRSHLLLPWLIDRYKLKKVINIIRNPYNVIGSQLKHGAWNKSAMKFDFSQFKYQEFYQKYEYLYKDINSNVEYLAFEWCLQNSYLFKHAYNNNKWINIYYEELFQNPENRLKEIFVYLNIDMPKEIIDKINIISSSGSQNELIIVANDKEKKIKNKLQLLTNQEIKIIDYYIEQFDLENYIFSIE